MKHTSLFLGSVLVVTAVLSGCNTAEDFDGAASSSSSSASVTYTGSGAMNLITLTEPTPGATVTSPLTIRGEARGNWYFEASFPVKLLDANNNQLAIAPAQAQGDWMTTDFVPYEVTLTFATPATSTGTLVLEKDNPSGEPQFDASVRVPVQF